MITPDELVREAPSGGAVMVCIVLLVLSIGPFLWILLRVKRQNKKEDRAPGRPKTPIDDVTLQAKR